MAGGNGSVLLPVSRVLKEEWKRVESLWADKTNGYPLHAKDCETDRGIDCVVQLGPKDPNSPHFGVSPDGLPAFALPGPPTICKVGIRSSIEGSGGNGRCGSD